MTDRIVVEVAQRSLSTVSIKMTYTRNGVVVMTRTRSLRTQDSAVLNQDRAVDLLAAVRDRVDWWARQFTFDL